MDIAGLDAAEAPDEVAGHIQRTLEQGQDRFETRHRRKDGSVFAVEVSVHYREIEGGRIFCFLHDLTERRDASTLLAAQQQRFQNIIEQAEAGYFRIGRDGCYEDVNPAWLLMHAFTSKADIIGQHFSKVQVPESWAQEGQVVTALQNGQGISGEAPRLLRDGTIGYHSFSANPVYGNDGIMAIEGFLIDTTRQKTAELEVERSERRYRSIFDSMNEGLAVHQLTYSGGVPDNYVLLDTNRRYEEILGIRRENVRNMLATEVYGTAVAPYLEEYAKVVQTGVPSKFETYFQPLGKHFLISVSPMGDGHFATIFSDTTEIRRRERQMLTLATAIEQAAETIVITDRDGLIQYCNPAFERITGYTKEEAIGLNPKVLKSGKHSTEFYRDLWETISAGKVWNGRLTNKKKDGTLYEEDATISPIREPAGNIVGFVALKRDVTEQLKLEQRYFQSQKLESIGRLAGGVAHDFNNLLTVINGYSGLLLQRMHASDPMRPPVDAIKTAGERAASLTRQLLAFSRKQVIAPQVWNLNQTIVEAVPMLERLIGEDIELQTSLDENLGTVMADPSQMHQVIMNFVINARDAMPDGGRIEIATANVDSVADAGNSLPDVNPGPYVRMEVSDTGAGIDEETRQHIFEPFFTTKESGKGTGLGLSTIYGIVKQNNGWITVQSEVGKGTAFVIYLPRLTAPAPSLAAPVVSARKGGETILLVEDQAAVRSFTAAALREFGYRVLEAASGEDAITLEHAHSGQIHLLLTDVVLTGMNGKAVSERLVASRPELRVVFMSGYTSDVISVRGILDRNSAFLQKPFHLDDLARKVREALDTP